MENKPKFVLMVGLPRSGKSTWIENNKDNDDGYVVISNDWIRENIFKSEHSRTTNPALWMITDATIRLLLSQNKNVIMDGVNHLKFVRSEFIVTAEEMNAEVVIVWVNTPLETCLVRNKGENYKLNNKRLKRFADEFEIPESSECNTLIKTEST